MRRKESERSRLYICKKLSNHITVGTMNAQNVLPWVWDPFTVRTKGPSLYYVSKRTRWVGSENDNFCWCSVLYLCWHSGWVKKVQKYADVIQGWSLINYCESRTFLSNLLAKSWQLFFVDNTTYIIWFDSLLFIWPWRPKAQHMTKVSITLRCTT